MRIYGINFENSDEKFVNKMRNFVYRLIKSNPNPEKIISGGEIFIRLESNTYSSTYFSNMIKLDMIRIIDNFNTTVKKKSSRALDIPEKFYISVKEEYNPTPKEEKKEESNFDFETLLNYMQDFNIRFVIKPCKYSDNFLVVIQTDSSDFSRKFSYKLMEKYRVKVGNDKEGKYVSFMCVGINNPNNVIKDVYNILRDMTS